MIWDVIGGDNGIGFALWMNSIVAACLLPDGGSVAYISILALLAIM